MNDVLVMVEPLIPALRRYARGLLREATAADDLVQDCLERVIAHWHRRRNDDPRTWVFAILHNLGVNKLRQRARRGEHLPIDQVEESALAIRAVQEDGLLQQGVLDAVAQLPGEQRSIILLVSLEDMSYAQVAAVLGIPIGTVMSRLSRARERLRQILEHPGGSIGKRGAHLRRVK
jgi:RNA polymerase sigma-70 factor (ECF subfamily)